MAAVKHTYNYFEKAAAVFLAAVIMWLTVSAPFIVNAGNKGIDKNVSVSWPAGEDEPGDTTDNGAEEKAPSGSSLLSEEYLHEQGCVHGSFAVAANSHGIHNSGIYIAFHGELHAPPPNAV